MVHRITKTQQIFMQKMPSGAKSLSSNLPTKQDVQMAQIEHSPAIQHIQPISFPFNSVMHFGEGDLVLQEV